MPDDSKRYGRLKKDHTQLQVWNIPISLKRRFKVKCAQKCVTIQETIINLIKEFCK